MKTSKRRLENTPSPKRGTMHRLTELEEVFITHLQALGRSQATITHYQDSFQLLKRCFTDSDILPTSANLTSQNMNTLASWLRATPTRVWRGSTQRSVYGVHGCLKDIKIWLKWCVEEGYLESLPKVPVPRLPQTLHRILSQDELDQIFQSESVAGSSELSVRNRALLSFMLDTGVRLSEVAGLKDSDIHLRDNEAKIRGKGGKERMVYFSDAVATYLQRWIAVRGESTEPTFWLAPAGVRQVFKRLKAELGLEVFTPHQMRHTALTMMVRNHADLHTVKRIAGHASVTTTESYLALAGDDVKRVHATASPFAQVHQRHQPTASSRRRLRTG